MEEGREIPDGNPHPIGSIHTGFLAAGVILCLLLESSGWKKSRPPLGLSLKARIFIGIYFEATSFSQRIEAKHGLNQNKKGSPG